MHVNHCHAFCQEQKKSNAETFSSHQSIFQFTSARTKSFIP